MKDGRYSTLGGPAQAALLTAVVQLADHDGWFKVKQRTLGDVVGRTDRRVRAALAECVNVGMLTVEPSRRPDGTQGANGYIVAADIMEQADEIVRLWTSGRTKSSSGTRADENVRLTRADENVRARTVSNGSLNGFDAFGSKAPAGEALENLKKSLAEENLLRTSATGAARHER